MRNGWSRRVLPTVAVGLVAVASMPSGFAAGTWHDYTPDSPPSGKYKDLVTDKIYEYDAATGTLTDTGVTDSQLCIGNRETGLHLAGVCADIDTINDQTSDAGYDAIGTVRIVGTTYQINMAIYINDVRVDECGTPSGHCRATSNLLVTYWNWGSLWEGLCLLYPAGSTLTARVDLEATDTVTGIRWTSTDSTLIHCP